jgi:molybdopterin-binding protein
LALTDSGAVAMKISARNVLSGTVKSLHEGPVSTEVVVQVAPGVEIVSTITTTSAKSLGLKPGAAVHAVIKASSVMIATD